MYMISKCCGSIPWEDKDICAECMKPSNFISSIEYNTQVLYCFERNKNMNKKILSLIEERLEEGKRKYGHENVETDGRDFIVESLEEILDCSVYIAAKLIEIQSKSDYLLHEESNESVT